MMEPHDGHDAARSDDAALVGKLLEAIPDLTVSYNEQLANNDELLPYVYLPDAVRALESQLNEGTLSAEDCGRLSIILEDALRSGGSARNLALLGLTGEIANSHVMSRMRHRRSLLDAIRGTLGERTKHAIAETLDSPSNAALLKASRRDSNA